MSKITLTPDAIWMPPTWSDAPSAGVPPLLARPEETSPAAKAPSLLGLPWWAWGLVGLGAVLLLGSKRR